MAKQMRAARYSEFGAATVLEITELDRLEPAPGEVLVRLHASGINPSDVKKRAGAFPDLLDEGFVIPNSDGAGIVEAVGDGIDKSRIGEHVWIYEAQYQRRFGTAAEFVAIESSRAQRLPEGVDFQVGACLGIPVMTAHRCVFADGDVKDRTLLVTGGAGRVGHYAIQWSSRAGARVIATASSDDDAEACRQAGADAVVNHQDGDFAAQVLDASNGDLVDRIVDVDFGANLKTSLDVIRDGGTIATYASMSNPEPVLPFYALMYKDLTVRFVIVYAMPESAKDHAIADISKALSSGWLEHRIAETLPLEEIVRGNELVEAGGVRGAVILTTG